MTSNLGYDKTNPESIRDFASKLTYRSLASTVELPKEENLRNRGDLGLLVEKYYFRYAPNSNHGPDFAEAGVELKTTGLVPSTGGRYKAKERLVLTTINYNDLVNEIWATSSLLRKCGLMLIMFYLYQRDVPVYDRKFVLEPLLYALPESDLPQIKRDWEFIQAKVEAGLAHELSEGDTFYLGACRKGSGGPNEKLSTQPRSTIGAKSRAFSFKQGYLNEIINRHQDSGASLGVTAAVSFEEATQRRFAPYINKSVTEISRLLEVEDGNEGNKRKHRTIAEKILFSGESSVSELTKAGIELKTIRLNNAGQPRESMSFPGFSFLEIVNEDWEDSKFFERIERKFLFVVFGPGTDGVERLTKVGYWNMPFADREEARAVFELTKSRLSNFQDQLPQESENRVAHVRPKARNAADKAPLPNGELKTKQAFWLNRKYIASVVQSL